MSFNRLPFQIACLKQRSPRPGCVSRPVGLLDVPDSSGGLELGRRTSPSGLGSSDGDREQSARESGCEFLLKSSCPTALFRLAVEGCRSPKTRLVAHSSGRSRLSWIPVNGVRWCHWQQRSCCRCCLMRVWDSSAQITSCTKSR